MILIIRYHLVFYSAAFMSPARRRAMQYILLAFIAGYIIGSIHLTVKLMPRLNLFINIISEFTSQCVSAPQVSKLIQAIQLLYGKRGEFQI